MAVAGDVPTVYDLVIGSHGYIFANTIDPNIPFRTQRAKFGYSPTFIERSNVSGNFGDNQQDFFLTVSQNDWSGGEGQAFLHIADQTTYNLFNTGVRGNVTVPGQYTLYPAESTLTVGSGGCKSGSSAWGTLTPLSLSTATNTFTFDTSFTNTDRGAHGLGVAPSCQCGSPGAIYLSSEAGGTVGVRRLDATSWTFATFSATGVSKILFLDNQLWGVRATSNFDLISYSSAGAVTSQFVWKDANGTAMLPGALIALIPIGGDIYIVFDREVWLWNGTGASKVQEFPNTFVANCACEAEGILYVGGTLSMDPTYVSQIRFLNGGTEGILWNSKNTLSSIAPWRNGLAFGLVRVDYYDLSSGAVSNMCFLNDSMPNMFTNSKVLCGFDPITPFHITYLVNGASMSGALSGVTLTSSAIDFDSSLDKIMRGVQVWFDQNGATGHLSLTMTCPDTGSTFTVSPVVSGTLYNPNLTGKSFTYALTFASLSGTLSMILKRVSLRASPVLTQYRNAEYILDFTGKDGHTPVQLRNGQDLPLSGQQQLANFLSDALSAGVLSFTDSISTYNGVVELGDLDIVEVRPSEYFVRFTTREI